VASQTYKFTRLDNCALEVGIKTLNVTCLLWSICTVLLIE